MTYCVALSVDNGLVFISDSRTNAGADDVSTYSKMYAFGSPGERQIVICAAGNLATTQAVIHAIEKDIEANASVNLMNVARMSDAATYLGELNVAAAKRTTGGGPVFNASFLIGGEISGARCRLFLVYPEGNYITCSDHASFLQIGETKYGRPILDRVVGSSTRLNSAILAGLLSMESTTRSNVTVGPPIELSVYTKGSLQPCQYHVFKDNDPYLQNLADRWTENLREAFTNLPPVDWLDLPA